MDRMASLAAEREDSGGADELVPVALVAWASSRTDAHGVVPAVECVAVLPTFAFLAALSSAILAAARLVVDPELVDLSK